MKTAFQRISENFQTIKLKKKTEQGVFELMYNLVMLIGGEEW